VIKKVIIVASAALALAGCTSGSSPNPSVGNLPPSPPAVSTSPSPSFGSETQEGAKLIYSDQGHGPTVLTLGVTTSVVSVRFTCVGTSKATSIKSVGGGTIMRTSGCLAGEIFGATFTRSAKLDPSKITLTVDPGTYWQIQVWSGKYIAHGTPARSDSPTPTSA